MSKLIQVDFENKKVTGSIKYESKTELKKTVVDYLENVLHFRDYTIVSKTKYGKIDKQGIHQIIDYSNLYDLDNAVDTFCKDGYSHIYFYL